MTVDRSEQLSCYYDLDENFAPTDEQFQQLYGEFSNEQATEFTASTPLCEIAVKRLGRHAIKKWTKGKTESEKRTLLAMPLSYFQFYPNMSRQIIDVMVEILNG